MTRSILAIGFSLVGCWSAAAQTSAAVSETVLRHRSAAAAYLRTGNVDLAAIEIEALEAGLESEPRRLAMQARAALERGDLAEASAALGQLRRALAADRKRHDIRILADCIEDAEAHLGAINPGREAPPDLSQPDARRLLAERAEAARLAVARCDREASRETASRPDFRRLVDGAAASLAQIPVALERRDGDLLHRLLIELRSFERLLAQRFG